LYRKALKRGAHFRQLNNNAQHDLRIDLKKLRYASVFFLPLYAGHASAKRYVARLSKLQGGPGRARDIATTRIFLDAIRQADQPELHLAIGAVAGWQARDQIAVAKTLRKEMAAVQGDAGILGPVSSSFAITCACRDETR
jgi:triphosphatase